MRGFCYLLLAAMLIALAAAFYFDVLSLSTDRLENTYIISLAIHTDRVNHVVPAQADAIVHGRIKAMGADEKSFTLTTTDNRDMTMQLDASTSVTGTTRGLQVGDRVAVTYQSRDGTNVARSVMVEAGP